MKNKTENLNCLLCVIYVYLNNILMFFSNREVLNNIVIIGLVVISVINNFKKFQLSKSFIFINLFMLITFLLTFLLNNNSSLDLEFLNYISSGLLTMYFFDKVTNYQKFFTYLINFSVVVFLFGALDPIFDYKMFGGYMTYGLFCILPSFILFHINRKYRHKKKFVILEILSALCLLYCNRNSILTAAVAIILLDFFLVEFNIKKIKKYLLLSLVSITLFLNINNIIIFLANEIGTESYAVRSLYYMVIEESNGLSGRDNIWDQSLYEIGENLLGSGIGSFTSTYGYYSHNIFLDFFLIYGIAGIFILIYLVYNILSKYRYYKKTEFYYFLLIIAITPLLFNTTFINWKYFWIMILFISKIPNNIKEKNYNNITLLPI